MHDNGNSSRARLLQGLYLLAAMNADRCTWRDKESNSIQFISCLV